MFVIRRPASCATACRQRRSLSCDARVVFHVMYVRSCSAGLPTTRGGTAHIEVGEEGREG